MSLSERAVTGRVIDLKTWPEPFAAIRAGLKPWELRFDDRDYQVGDTLRLREWNYNFDGGVYTGEVEERVVIWKLDGGRFGLPKGYAILSLARAEGVAALQQAADHVPDVGRMVQQPAEPVAFELGAFKSWTGGADVVSYIARYGGMCRGCADEHGICPGSGLPCDDEEKPIRHVLEALSYGLRHGYITLPQQTALVEQGVEKIIGQHEPTACGASAPSEPAEPPCPKRGEIRVIDGRRMRFIERELEGDKWEIL